MKQQRARSHGFSLIEVLIALIIIGVGMLGIAKLQALSYASTGTASLRSLAAIEAASMASAMRANRNYWSVTAGTSGANAVQTIQITNGTVSSSTDGQLTTSAVDCSAAVCSNNAQLAAYDLLQWAKSLYALLPSDTATVTCIPPAPANPNYPVGCNITVNWVERQAGINAQSSGTATPMTAPSYTLYVEP
jgi:type IV pilus assembly protein PilV